MSRKFYTSDDVDALRARGIRELVVDKDDVILDMAREAAARYEIAIVYRTSENCPSPVSGGEVTPRYDLQRWRGQFPILKQGVYLASCSHSPQSIRVRNSIDHLLSDWNERGMDQEVWLEMVHLSKAEFAHLIHAGPSEIALSTSVSQALASVAGSLDFSGKRNKVVLTEADFPTVIHAWTACQRYGVDLKWIPVTQGEIHLSEYEKAIDEKTLITSVTHVSYQNGFKQDLGAICDIAHRKGSLVFVDAYQSLGTEPIDVKVSDVDMLASGNSKFLLGVSGSAYLYVKKELIPYLKPAAARWFGQEDPFAQGFEMGTPSLLSVAAAKTGMEMIREVGPQNIQDWIDGLSRYTLDELNRRGFGTDSPADLKKKGAITSVRVRSPATVEAHLKQRGVVGSATGSVIRLAPHFFVSRADIDRALDGLEEVVHLSS